MELAKKTSRVDLVEVMKGERPCVLRREDALTLGTRAHDIVA